MLPLFIIALVFAYKKDMNEYVKTYNKKGQFIFYIGIIGFIVVSLTYSILKWIES